MSRRVTSDEATQPTSEARSGAVAIVGRPNVGKSTFLNAALAVELAITSKTPQTTRTTLLGVVRREVDGAPAEIRLLDTPGLHEFTDTALNRRMNLAARGASAEADLVVLMVGVPSAAPSRSLAPHPADIAIAKELAGPVLLVLNKIDRIKDKSRLLGLIEAWSKVRPFEAIVPVSALSDDGVGIVLDEIARRLPVAPHAFSEDDLTDRPLRYFAAEYVREQILRRAHEEVPHATSVTIDVFEESAERAHISATIHVERLGQKKIVIGAGGSMLKQIGTEARRRIAELLGKPVHLELFVRETPGWRDSPALLEEMGYAEVAEPRGAQRAPQKQKKSKPRRRS